jgi:hypothetical protein
MVRNQSPGVAGGIRVGKDITESFEVLIAFAVVVKYHATVDAPDDDVLQCTTCVYAFFARHDGLLTSE